MNTLWQDLRYGARSNYHNSSNYYCNRFSQPRSDLKQIWLSAVTVLSNS